ncbi:MAG TPA: hypothetical protein DCZ63_03200 [Geobacter sp.]|nr:hypothetical protein [Geobacter sp.]
MPSRPDVTASYAISVRRAGILLAASFRFRLATDTLAVRLMVPTIRVHRGLSPPSHCLTTTVKQMSLTRHAPCWAHTARQNSGGFLAAASVLLDVPLFEVMFTQTTPAATSQYFSAVCATGVVSGICNQLLIRLFLGI